MAEIVGYMQGGSSPATLDRLFADSAIGGTEGVLGGTELKIRAASSGLALVCGVGRAAILSDIAMEGTYMGAETTEKTITLNPPSSTQYRTDLIVARVTDSVLVPGDSTSLFSVEAVAGTFSGSNPAPTPTPTFQRYIPLGRANIGPNALVPGAVIDMRFLANPRSKTQLFTLYGGSSSTLTSSTTVDWPTGASWTIARPSWATYATFRLNLASLAQNSPGPSQFNVKIWCDGQVSRAQRLKFDTSDALRMNPFHYVDTISLPLNTSNTWKVQAARVSGSGSVTHDAGSQAALEITWYEGLQ